MDNYAGTNLSMFNTYLIHISGLTFSNAFPPKSNNIIFNAVSIKHLLDFNFITVKPQYNVLRK